MKNLFLLIILAFAFTFTSCEKSAYSPYVGTYDAVLISTTYNENVKMKISEVGQNLEVEISGDFPAFYINVHEENDTLKAIPCTQCLDLIMNQATDLKKGTLYKENGKIVLQFFYGNFSKKVTITEI